MAGLRVSPDLALSLDVITQSIALLAVRRAGKSNAAAVLAEEMHHAGLPWVVIDPKGDWWGLRSSNDGTGPGLHIPIFGGLHGDMPLAPEAGTLIAELIVDENLTCVLDVSEFASKAAQMRFLTDLGERLFRLHGKHPQPRHLFLEEADDFIPQRVMANQARCVGAWTRIVKQGGSRGLGITIISQRSAVVNKDALSVASWMRTPVWQGWHGRSLRSMEQLWEQGARAHPIQQGDGYEYVEFLAGENENALKTLCFKGGMGWWAPIRRIIRHRYDGPMIRLMQKWGEVVVTPNHSVYSTDGSLTKPQDNPEVLAIRHINQQHTRDWEKVTLAAPDSNFVIEDGWIRARDSIGRPKRSRLKRELKGADLEAFCRFLGAFLSEGSVHRAVERGNGSSWIIQISNVDRPWLEAIANDIRQFTAAPASVHIHKGSTPGVWQLSLSHMALGKWLAKNCGQHAALKRFPDFVFNLAKPYAVILLNHLNDGDGQWLESGRWRYATKSAELAQGVGLLCSLHGLGYTVYRDRVTDVYSVLQCNWYNHRDAEQRVMETIPYQGWVYDLEIDDRYSHNFTIGVGNVVVHNTQAETLIALRTTSPQDRKAILDWVSYHDVARELVDSLPGLDDGEAWVCSPHWLGRYGHPPIQRIRFRQRATFDSGATPTLAAGKRVATLADIDLGAILGRMESVVAKAAQDDPKALRKRIAELERQLATTRKPGAVEVWASERVTKLEHQLAEALARPPERVEVPVLPPGDIAALDQSVTAMRETADRIEMALRHAQRAAPSTPMPPAPAAVTRKPPAAAPVPAQSRAEGTGEPDGEFKLGKAHRAFLAVLAQFPEGRTRNQLAMLSGYSVKSSMMDKALSQLRSAGFVEPGQPLRATQAGIGALGDEYDPLPTGPDLIASWMGRLGKAERTFLQALLDVWPGTLTKAQIAEATGYSGKSSMLDKGLSRLRTLELIDGFGDIRADETLAEHAQGMPALLPGGGNG